MDNRARFSDRVEDYVKYRPHYPGEVLSFLEKEISFSPENIVADIGSGTGISAELFLANGNPVFGVEPNQEMRKKCEELLGGNTKFTSINGSSENTTLNDESCDLVVAAQAFHWFDPIRSKVEFRRILKRDGKCLLIWNERLVRSEFEKDYEALLLRFATDYTSIDHRNVTMEKIEAFLNKPIKTTIFDNSQTFDFEGLKGRLLSSSYVPNKESEVFFKMITVLKDIFEKNRNNGVVTFHYETKVFLGSLAK